mgnify:CR=1 FL=1
MTTTRITKIGNSRGVILPANVLRSLSLDEGDKVEIFYDEATQVLSLTFPKVKQLKLSIK